MCSTPGSLPGYGQSKYLKDISNPGNADIKYYYPTNTLVTAPEIIFFWVARMIMADLNT